MIPSPISRAVVLVVLAAGLLHAQTPQFGGTWKLDRERSRLAPAARVAGLSAASAPDVLHVTDAANGTLILESRINESHARVYTPGRKTSTPVTVGPAGHVTMTSRRAGRSVTSEGQQEVADGAGTTVVQIREILTLSADGGTLTLQIAASGGAGGSESTLVYTKTGVVEPCQTWPAPCKSPGR